MSKTAKISVKFDPSQIKPLDGSPMMSANCWNAVLETLSARVASGGKVRCLEWGAGNSTVSLVRHGAPAANGFELVSVEHETNFFHWLAESILGEFLEAPVREDLRVSWQPLRPAVLPPSTAASIVRSHRALECASLGLRILTGNRTLQESEGMRPSFRLSLPKLFRQGAKLSLVWLGYAAWLAQAAFRGLVLKSTSSQTHDLEAPTFHMEGVDAAKGKFFTHFQAEPASGRLLIERGQVRVELWHLPPLATVFWDKGLLLDGTMHQLSAYVDVPLEGKFDVVFIDGRARVSCIKRTHRDRLLKDGGSLFVHDAFRAEMMEGFRLFGDAFTFIRGSNRTLNGQARCVEGFGLPLARVGDALGDLRWEISQELFMFKNESEHAKS